MIPVETGNDRSAYIRFLKNITYNIIIHMDSIQVTGHPDPILINSIVWLEGEANYTRIHRLDNTSSMVTQSLYWFEQYVNFIRVHRSAIINPVYVVEFGHKKGRSGWVRLINDKVVMISRAYLELTIKRLVLSNISKLSLNKAPDN